MDVFFEQIVNRKKVGFIKIKSILILVVGIFAVLFFLWLVPILQAFSILGIAGAFGCGYATYYLYTSQNVEYEYIITNGELDVDKIIAQRRRTRLLTTKIGTWEQFGFYNHARHTADNYDSRVLVCENPEDDNNYFAVFNHSTLGKTFLVFCPNEKLLENTKRYISKTAIK